MVQVPTYGDQRVAVAPAPDLRDSRRASEEEFGSGLARGAGAIADAAGKVFVSEEQKAIQQAKQVRLLGLKNEYDNYMAPKQAAWSQRGGLDAQKNIGEFRDEHTKLVGELTADLDPDTRAAFEAYAADAYTTNNRTLLFHAAKETKVYEGQQYKARREIFRNSAYNAPDMLTVGNLLRAQRQEDLAFAERNGLDEDSTFQLVRSNESMAVRAQIERLLDDERDLDAEQLYKDYKNVLLADDQQVMGKAVELGSTKAKAQRIGDEIFDQVVSGEMTADEALKTLREKAGDNPKVREMATAHYRSLQGMRQEARQAETGLAWDEAMRALAQNNGDIGKVPTATMARLEQLDPESIVKLNSFASNWNPGRQTDDMAWLQLRQDAATGKLADMEIIDFYGRYHDLFSSADWDRAQDMWGKAKGAKDSPEKAAEWAGITDGVRSELEMFKQVLTERGYDYDTIVKGGDAPENKQAMQVLVALDQAVADRKRELSMQEKRKVDKLPPEEMYKVVSSTLQAISEPGKDPWGRGDYRNLPQFRKVPEADAAKIRADWKRVRGDTPTDADVAETYYRAQRAQGR